MSKEDAQLKYIELFKAVRFILLPVGLDELMKGTRGRQPRGQGQAPRCS